MARTVLAFLVFMLAAASGSLSAQETDGAEAGRWTGSVFINANIDFRLSLGKDANINAVQLPFAASVDVKLPFARQQQAGLVFWTLGGTFFYSALGGGSHTSNIGFGIRPAVHIAGPSLLKRLFKGEAVHNVQAYLAVPAGYIVQRRNGVMAEDGSGFHAGVDVGVQYFLAKNLGLYVELSVTTRWIGGSFGWAVRF